MPTVEDRRCCPTQLTRTLHNAVAEMQRTAHPSYLGVNKLLAPLNERHRQAVGDVAEDIVNRREQLVDNLERFGHLRHRLHEFSLPDRMRLREEALAAQADAVQLRRDEQQVAGALRTAIYEHRHLR